MCAEIEKWSDFTEKLVEREKILTELTFSQGTKYTMNIPPLIQASVILVEDLIKAGSKLNLIVLPERKHSFFFMLISRLLYGLNKGRINKKYDPRNFNVGEKLKLGRSVVQVAGHSYSDDGEPRIKLKFARDLFVTAPNNYLPYFQKTNTNRGLSTSEKFHEEWDKIKAFSSNPPIGNFFLSDLINHRTHMDNSVYCLTILARAEDFIQKYKIEDKNLDEVFLFGRTNYEGEVNSIGKGQLTGIPAVVFSTDFFDLLEAIENGNPAQAIMIDNYDEKKLLSNLDKLDETIALNLPITIVSDSINAFNTSSLEERGFKVWRWGSSNLTENLTTGTKFSPINLKAENCEKFVFEEVILDGNEIQRVMELISPLKHEIQRQSSNMSIMYDHLMSLIFRAFRSIIPFNSNIREQAKKRLDVCEKILEDEKNYVNDESISKYKEAINLLKEIFKEGYELPKIETVKDIIVNSRHDKIFMIVSDQTDKTEVEVFWRETLNYSGIQKRIEVLNPEQHYLTEYRGSTLTIISGWFRRAIMKKLIFNYSTNDYVLLLYEYENNWKSYAERKWHNSIKMDGTTEILEKQYDLPRNLVTSWKSQPLDFDVPSRDVVIDELEELDLVLKENRYKVYENNYGNSYQEKVEAVPVYFVGEKMAFFGMRHDLVRVTNILFNNKAQIEEVKPDELKVGDFVVIRETDKNIIKDMADIILENSGEADARDIATEWREPLLEARATQSVSEIFNKLKASGCKRGRQTVYTWITDDDKISPQNEVDILHIAMAFNKEELLDRERIILEAAEKVYAAHQKAGIYLARLIRSKVGDVLQDLNIDPVNFWEPIDIQVENLGHIKILKVTNIGDVRTVSSGVTNRLLDGFGGQYG